MNDLGMNELPPMARGFIDRAGHHRSDDTWLNSAWNDEDSRVLVVKDGRALVAGDHLAWTTAAAAPTGDRLFLGVPPGSSTAAYFAVMAELPAEAAARPGSLRDVGAQLDPVEAGLLAEAAALEQWHARHPYCPRCGAETVAAMGGHLRRCVADGSEHYPRTDPAVIMLVVDDDDRALLAGQPAWPKGRKSTLAGYVDAGETLEQAVAREVFEEVGVTVDRIHYVASQPWPFPSSLMLAFTAHATSTSINVDGAEISEARWFTRKELATALDDETLRLPMRASVAYYLIDTWFGGLPRLR